MHFMAVWVVLFVYSRVLGVRPLLLAVGAATLPISDGKSTLSAKE